MTNEQLAALDAAATQGVWEFDGNCGGYITQSNGAERIGRFYAAADPMFTAAIVNAYRAGQLVVRTEPSEADVERVAQNLQDHMEQRHGVCLKASEWDAAAIAAMVPHD